MIRRIWLIPLVILMGFLKCNLLYLAFNDFRHVKYEGQFVTEIGSPIVEIHGILNEPSWYDEQYLNKTIYFEVLIKPPSKGFEIDDLSFKLLDKDGKLINYKYLLYHYGRKGYEGDASFLGELPNARDIGSEQVLLGNKIYNDDILLAYVYDVATADNSTLKLDYVFKYKVNNKKYKEHKKIEYRKIIDEMVMSGSD